MPAPGTNPMLVSGILWCDPAFCKPSRFHTKADIRIKVHQTNGVSRPIKVCHKFICPGLRLIVRCLKSITGPWREVPAFFCFVYVHAPPPLTSLCQPRTEHEQRSLPMLCCHEQPKDTSISECPYFVRLVLSGRQPTSPKRGPKDPCASSV